MERKGLRKRDILRIDGLLPPSRRVPVCAAVSNLDKKKDKKWSIGGILRRISSMRDYDSSSNDEEIVYCKRTPRKPARLDSRRADVAGEVVVHSLDHSSESAKQARAPGSLRQLTDSPHPRRDSLHSRSSDGSLDGLGGKFRRKNKLTKARAEAKRDHLRADSSSDDDCRRSNSSLNRLHGSTDAASFREDGPHNTNNNSNNNNTYNRRTRAARTERYIKRLSRDDGNTSGDTLNLDPYSRRCSAEHNADKERAVHERIDVNGSCRPPVHPRRSAILYPGARLPLPQKQRSLGDHVDHAGLADPRSATDDFRRYSTGQYLTDLNQNDAYGKIAYDKPSVGDTCADDRLAGNFFTYPAKNACCQYYTEDRRRSIANTDNRPPEPPPRDPRYRVYGYGYGSYPANRHQNLPSYLKHDGNVIDSGTAPVAADWPCFRSSNGSGNLMARYGTMQHETMDDSTTSPAVGTELRNSLERANNNKYNSGRHRPPSLMESAATRGGETEAARCRRRNTRNDQLNRNDAPCDPANKSASIWESHKRHAASISSRASAASSDWPPDRSSPRSQNISRVIGPPMRRENIDNRATEPGHEEKQKEEEEENKRRRAAAMATSTDDALERRRCSRNLEEALSELEAIYNSLRLGDEDLLDRAELRTMEEFSSKQRDRGGEPDTVTAITTDTTDSADRTKDDMAYRRMHPKTRPTSLSDIAGQLALSRISYLMASPVLSRRDSADDLAPLANTRPSRRDVPDITRDDVVFRSINRANNTLRVMDPQPPFGIPLGPVTAATESDYLHTTPKPETPRSPYIPQCEPDVVTDDLAYRALRKDTLPGWRNLAGPHEKKLPVDEVAREAAETTCAGVRKKRAVRSLSANLYGLINHEGIHLRREPSLDAIRDEIRDVTRDLDAMPERSGYLRRVVSDGELSDNDARRRKEPAVDVEGDIDINGNHPAMGAYRGELCVYAPATTMTTTGSPKQEEESSIADGSSARSSTTAALDDEFWREYLKHSDLNALPIDGRHGDHGMEETDFTAYSRLCQDLVNLIKSDDDGRSETGYAPSTPDDSVVVAVTPIDQPVDLDTETRVESLADATRPLASRYSGSPRANDEWRMMAAGSSANVNAEASSGAESTSSRNLDFYLRVADENVKLIAEAFSTVADQLRDSRSISARENSSLSRSSETECQSGSTRSSTLYSQEDRQTNDNEGDNDDRLQVIPPAGSSEETTVRVTPKRDLPASNKGDQDDRGGASHPGDVSTAELDLSRAVRDLQLAAASLCEHGQQIEDLGTRRGRIGDAIVQEVTPIRDASEEDRPTGRLGLVADALKRQQERDERDQQEEAAVDQGEMGEMGARRDENARDGKEGRAGLQALARSQ